MVFLSLSKFDCDSLEKVAERLVSQEQGKVGAFFLCQVREIPNSASHLYCAVMALVLGGMGRVWFHTCRLQFFQLARKHHFCFTTKVLVRLGHWKSEFMESQEIFLAVYLTKVILFFLCFSWHCVHCERQASSDLQAWWWQPHLYGYCTPWEGELTCDFQG